MRLASDRHVRPATARTPRGRTAPDRPAGTRHPPPDACQLILSCISGLSINMAVRDPPERGGPPPACRMPGRTGMGPAARAAGSRRGRGLGGFEDPSRAIPMMAPARLGPASARIGSRGRAAALPGPLSITSREVGRPRCRYSDPEDVPGQDRLPDRVERKRAPPVPPIIPAAVPRRSSRRPVPRGPSPTSDGSPPRAEAVRGPCWRESMRPVSARRAYVDKNPRRESHHGRPLNATGGSTRSD
jgi:hypothetical protein